MFFFLAQTEQGDIFKITLETDEDMVRLICHHIIVLGSSHTASKYAVHSYAGATRTQGPPVPRGHSYPGATRTQVSLVRRGHLFAGATCTQRPLVRRGHSYAGATHTQGTPVPRGHSYAGASLIRPTLQVSLHSCIGALLISVVHITRLAPVLVLHFIPRSI